MAQKEKRLRSQRKDNSDTEWDEEEGVTGNLMMTQQLSYYFRIQSHLNNFTTLWVWTQSFC